MISVAVALLELGLAEGTEAADVRRDAILARMIEAVTATLSRELNRYCGLPEVVVEHHRGGRPTIFVRDDITPDGDPPTVQWRQTAVDEWADVATTEYGVVGRALRHASAWPGDRDSIKVAYARGFAVDTAPEELRELVLDAVTQKWNTTQEGDGLQSETIGDYSYTNFSADELVGAAGGVGSWRNFVQRWRRKLT